MMIDDVEKSRVSLQRRRLVLRLKKLWRAASGHPPACELIAKLEKRLAEKRAAMEHQVAPSVREASEQNSRQ